MLARRSAPGLVAIALAGAVALTGCSGNDSKDAKDAASSSSAAKSASAKASVNEAGISPKDLPTEPTLKELEGARKDFTLAGACDTKVGDQKVSGTLKSSAKTERDYVVVINWVHGSDVMGRAVKLVENVAPGQEVKVDLTTKLTKAADACTVRVTRGVK